MRAVGFGAGAPASGVTLIATASPFAALPPEIWQSFKRQIMDAGKAWGLQVAVSDHPTIREAEQRFFQMTRVMASAEPDAGEAAK